MSDNSLSKQDFILGCNYWASHAGTEMWRQWREDIVRKDLQTLAENGISYLRVFPNWRDFQPVEPLYGGGGSFYEYRMASNPQEKGSPYYLDSMMMQRFIRFCEIAEEVQLKLIVGLIIGWMSGRLFIPSALYGKNLYTDPVALMFQQKFIRGFISQTKLQPAIVAWDLGNECNCMSQAPNREAAYTWSSMIANAIRAADSTRPIISGMHSLGMQGIWTIQDQAETTDMLTTHPYPYWVRHCSQDKISSIRTLLSATAETKLYSDIGGRPCLVEELGTMGPMICNDEVAAKFLHVNLFSNWAHGASGVMWWCACEQSMLNTPPYCWNMCERELGMLDAQGMPKPVLSEIKEFDKFLKKLDFSLPPAQTDGVCLLTLDQDQWGVAYMSYILAKQAGKTLRFAFSEESIPDSPVYLLPAIHGHLVMNKKSYDQLKEKVWNGAVLYISWDGGFLTEFSQLTGLSIMDSENSRKRGTFSLDGEELEYQCDRQLILESCGAEVLADIEGNPAFSVYRYGKGSVYFLNMSPEKVLLDQNEGFRHNYWRLYERVFRSSVQTVPIQVENPLVGFTYHPISQETAYVVMVNYSCEFQKTGFCLSDSYTVEKVEYGDVDSLPPYDACIVRITCKEPNCNVSS